MRYLRLILAYLHPWPNDLGFLVAAGRGWYRDAGIDVEIGVADPQRGDSLASLLAGEADFAVFPTNRLLVRCARGEPLVSVAAVNHRPLEAIQTIVATGITRPRELAGRRVAYNPTPRGVAMVRHLVAADGGDPDAVVTIDAGARELTVDDIAAGEADATFGGYWAWDVLRGELAERDRVTWPVDEIGAPRYHSYLLGCRRALANADPDLVRRFLAVTERGYLAAAQDGELAAAALERMIPFFARALLARSRTLVAPTWTRDGRWGHHDPDLLDGYSQWLEEHGILSRASVWRDACRDDLLPAAAPR